MNMLMLRSKRFKRMILYINCLLFFITTSCSDANWKVYTDNVNHFKISYPDKWEKKSANESIIFISPKVNAQDNFQENLNLMLQDAGGQNLDLEKYTAITKKQVIDNLGGNSIVSLKDISIAGFKGKEFVYNMNYNGRNLKLKQYWFIKEGIAYLLTFTAAPSEYDYYQNKADDIVKSLRFF